jgi:hypothetical protein
MTAAAALLISCLGTRCCPDPTDRATPEALPRQTTKRTIR